jgi:ABC-type multidrug transport system permease subunit
MSAIIFGKSMLGLVRGMLGCFLMYALGLVLAPDLQLTPLAVICVILSCLIFSMLGVLAALLAKSHQSMATFNSLIILPMTFLCGTFFSVSSLDPVFQVILYCLPLTHTSSCVRAACLPQVLDFPWWSLGVLLIFGAIVFAICYYLLKNRKI